MFIVNMLHKVFAAPEDRNVLRRILACKHCAPLERLSPSNFRVYKHWAPPELKRLVAAHLLANRTLQLPGDKKLAKRVKHRPKRIRTEQHRLIMRWVILVSRRLLEIKRAKFRVVHRF